MQEEIASANEIRLIRPTRFDGFKGFFTDVNSNSRANSANENGIPVQLALHSPHEYL
jgi:hypothetical protein